jgi:hypothetical protein
VLFEIDSEPIPTALRLASSIALDLSIPVSDAILAGLLAEQPLHG